MPTAFDDTVLEDPALALAEAREEAARSSAEAEGHSAGVSGRSTPRASRARTDDGLTAAQGPVADPLGTAAVPPVPPVPATDLPLSGPVGHDPEGPARG